jgi:hypothetical protein
MLRHYLSAVSTRYRRLVQWLRVRRRASTPEHPQEGVSDAKVIHWTANPEEFKAVKKACGKCSDDQPCPFHRAAEQRVR